MRFPQQIHYPDGTLALLTDPLIHTDYGAEFMAYAAEKLTFKQIEGSKSEQLVTMHMLFVKKPKD